MQESRFGWRHSIRVVLALGWSDFALKYRGSVLGYLWSFASPLVQFVVVFHVFRPFVADRIESYPLYLFLGIILWEHFCNTTAGCIAMLDDKAAIIRQVAVPKVLLIFSVGWTTLLIFATRFLIFCIFAFALGVHAGIAFLALPVILLQMTLLGLGLGMLLSSYALKYRDISHLWNVGLQVLFWLSPIVYPYATQGTVLDEFRAIVAGGMPRPAEWLDAFIRFQPFSLLMHGARRSLLYAATDFPSPAFFASVTLVCAAFFVAGLLLFSLRNRFFAQEY